MFFIYFYCYFVFALKRAYVYIDANSSCQMTNMFKNDLLYIVNKIIYLSIYDLDQNGCGYLLTPFHTIINEQPLS